jgi:phosphoribosylformylglycinamidine synthase subunit PurS
MTYQVEVRVVPRRGILDPQGKAVQGALGALGFDGVGEVHVGRLIQLTLDAASEDDAEAHAVRMCRQLLANPVTEDFDVTVREVAEATR